MIEFFQNYGIWIVLIGVLFLMHRLGIGCCGGHSHGQGHNRGDVPRVEPNTTDAKATAGEKAAALEGTSRRAGAATIEPGRRPDAREG